MAGDSQEILIVVSKLKQYIKQQAGMNTAEAVSGVLSDHLRHLCDQAVAHAAEEGRKTVMDRDFEPFIDVQ
jgi:histone H3/H4